LIYAARLTDDPAQKADWLDKAVSHVSRLGSTFGANRNPGSSGTWQRSYWDWNQDSPTYGEFLFNEAKQGYGDGTSWSRGQAWFVYGSSVAYAYTFEESLLPCIKEQVDYFLANLPDRFPGAQQRPGKFIPSWDFDYALSGNADPLAGDFGPQPDTEVDTSAASTALAGLLQLVAALPESDPDRARYLADAESILLDLCSETYLCDVDDPELSILRHGCYHHHKAVQSSSHYDNGLIWGDFFFVWSLWCYLDLTDDRTDVLDTLRIESNPAPATSLTIRYQRPTGSLPFGFRLEHSPDMTEWQSLSPASEIVVPGFDDTESVEFVIEPGSVEWGDAAFLRLVR
jgi:hypothetical protein